MIVMIFFFNCQVIGCQSSEHRKNIANFYDVIVKSLEMLTTSFKTDKMKRTTLKLFLVGTEM